MSLDPKLSSSVLQSVEQGFTDQLAFTQTMMRFPSLRGAEHAVQDFVFQTLRARGYALDRFEMDEAALQRHEGAGLYSEQHSRAPIVVGIHRPRSEIRAVSYPASPCRRRAAGTCGHVDPPSV